MGIAAESGHVAAIDTGGAEILQPAGWKRPAGYANGVAVSGRLIFVSGQIGWDAQQVFRSSDLVDQVRQALANVVTVLAAGGALPEHIVRLNWYLADKTEYKVRRVEIGEVYRELIGNHYPAMTAVQVCEFIEDGACVELEVTAVIPLG
jgi:enamine deaminase RidA (YjgF/YER057c/UK114 family)